MPTLQNVTLGLEYDLNGVVPVQANGTIKGREFYFHAKHSNWTFEMANDLGQLPSDVGGNAVFFVDSRWKSAGYMSVEDATRIIEGCAALYLATSSDRSGSGTR